MDFGQMQDQHNNNKLIYSFLWVMLQLGILSMMTLFALITCSKGKKKRGKDATIENLKGKHDKSKEGVAAKHDNKNSQLGGHDNLNKDKKDEKRGKERHSQPKSDSKQAVKKGGSNEGIAIRTAQMKSGKGSSIGRACKTAQYATFRGTSTAHLFNKSSVKATPSATAIVRKDFAVGVPKYKFVGNIDEDIVRKPSTELLEGFGPKHAYDRSSQKHKVREPREGKVVELVDRKNILYVSVDASKTKSMTK